MKATFNNEKEICRQIAAALRWNEKNAANSAQILISKALWLGLDIDQAIKLICELPGAEYARKNIHVLLEACQTVSFTINDMAEQVDDFERLLKGGF